MAASKVKRKRRIRETRIVDADVLCPFYQWHTDKDVCCESPDAGLRVRIEGRSNRVRDKMAMHCTSYRWKECPWARQLLRMYEETEKF